MTESHTLGTNLTQFLMRSHSIETADLERSDMGDGDWISLLMYEENVVFQLPLGEDPSVRARHEAAGGEGVPRSSLQVALDRIENPQQVMEGR